jgi:hypothetical protein
MLVEHLYIDRGATTAESLKETPMGVGALIGPHRTLGWGPGQVLNEVSGG